jgi:hypothetical protein
MPTTEIPAATGPVSDCCTVCNGVSHGKPVDVLDAYETALETSASPAKVRNCLLVTRPISFPAIFRILFNMPISSSSVECFSYAPAANA